MIVNRTTFKLIVLFLFGHFSINAQMVGADGYIVGNFVEIGIDGSGGFEGVETGASPPPAGTHMRTNSTRFGFVANPANDNWATQDGDFFTPGQPENGWGIQIGNTLLGNNAMSLTGGLEQNEILGTITDWTQKGDCISLTWDGVTSGGLAISINYFLDITEVFYTTTINITNNTGALIPEMFYYRSLDPDNNQSNGADYSTINEVEEQPGIGACKVALVNASQSFPNNSYLGLAAIGSNWRAGHGGFSNRIGSNMWNGVGFNQTVNVSVDNDVAIYLANRITNLALGASKELKFVTILKASDARAAIDGLMKLKYPGSNTNINAGTCNPLEDTVRLCVGATSSLSVEGATTDSYIWAWSPPTGLNTTTGPNVNLTTPGTNLSYTVTGTPANSCVPNDVVVSFKVIPSLPSSAIVPTDISVCNGEEVPITSFTSTPVGGLFTWTNSNTFIGLDAVGTGSVPVFVAKNTTGAPIIATITVNSTLPGGCLGPDSTYQITVNPIQNLIVTNPTTVCASKTADLTAESITAGSTGGATLTYWTDFLATNALTNPTAVGTSGTYFIQQGTSVCADIKPVIVNSAPSPEITNTDTVFCQNDSTVNLTTKESGGSWSELNETYGALDVSKSEFKIDSSGVFKLQYGFTGECPDYDTITLKIIEIPTISFASMDTLCVDTSIITISNSVVPISSILTWTGDVDVNGKFNPNDNIGDNNIILTANNEGCTNFDTLKIHVLKRANAKIVSVPSFCANDTVSYSLSSVISGQNGFWTGSGITDSIFKGNSAGAGNHLIRHEVPGLCGDWDTLTVTVKPPIIPSINSISSLCKGSDPINLVANPVGGAWEDLGGGNTYISSSGSFNPLDSGSYNFVYSITNPCKASDTVSVIINNVPTTSFSFTPREGCMPLEVVLTDMSLETPSQSLWDFGNNETSIDLSGTVRQLYSTFGCFDITLTNSYANGCSSETKILNAVCTYSIPKANFSWSPQVLDIDNNQALFDDLSIGNIEGWKWDFSDVAQPSQSSPTTTYQTIDPYHENSENPLVLFDSPNGDIINVKLKVTSINGCSDSVVKPVTILDKLSVYLPNAFTPNNDGINDKFFPKGRNLEFGDNYDFRIFNRSGKLIWKSEIPYQGWDGRIRESSTSSGEIAQIDVYVWRLTFIDSFTGKKYELFGTVTLMM
jgi:gliding motility-associated-like protein